MSKKEERQKIKATVKSTIASVLAEDETTQKAKMEEVFDNYETTLAELRDAEVAANQKNADLTAQIESLAAEKEALETELVSVKDELAASKRTLEDVTKKSSELEKKITEMEAEAAMQRRVKELEEAGLLSSGKSADRLKARIKGMSDEEYAEFKSDLELWKSDLMKDMPAPEKGAAEPVTEPAPAAPKVEPAPVAPKAEPVAPVVDTAATPAPADTVVKAEPVTASAEPTEPAAPAADTEPVDSTVSDSESAKMTAAKLIQLKKDLASLNLKTTISLEDDEALVQEYASILWPEKEESK